MDNLVFSSPKVTDLKKNNSDNAKLLKIKEKRKVSEIISTSNKHIPDNEPSQHDECSTKNYSKYFDDWYTSEKRLCQPPSQQTIPKRDTNLSTEYLKYTPLNSNLIN